MARKFIILDLHAVHASSIIGLAFALLALGETYWLLRERDELRRKAVQCPSAPSG